MSSNANSPGVVRSVERAVDILQSFSPGHPWMSVGDIQRKVGLSRPTLYRLLHTLASRGLVRIEGDPQRFALDYGVGRLAHSWTAGLDVIATARPILVRLRAETGETAALFVVRGSFRQCILELTSPQVLAMSRGAGETDHVGRGATGKAILAFMDENEIPAALRTLPRGMDRKRLLADLERVRKDRLAISRGEVFVGAIAIAAPYFNHARNVAGSIGVYGPQARLDEQWISRTKASILRAAAQLSAALGHASSEAPG
jgi:DNA-binding IclR family transcriptional regulator